MNLFRTESDSFGNLEVPSNMYYGAQSARSLINFPIGTETMPKPLIRALAMVKQSCAQVNVDFGVVDANIGKAIIHSSG